jgi:hypothetical protein
VIRLLERLGWERASALIERPGVVTDDGLITRGAGYFDLWGFFAQLGLPLHGPFAWPFEAWPLAREQERRAPIE